MGKVDTYARNTETGDSEMSVFRKTLADQMDWSRQTFGGGSRTEGNCKHIEKELSEIREDPMDVEEWIDVAMLAFDGAWRALEDMGHDPKAIPALIVNAYQAKLDKNIRRKWAPPNSHDQPNEHVAEG